VLGPLLDVAAHVDEEGGRRVFADHPRGGEHVIGHAEAAAEVLVAGQPVATARKFGLFSGDVFGDRPGQQHVAAADGLGGDGAPLPAEHRTAEHGRPLLFPRRLVLGFGVQPPGQHRGVHHGHERDGRVPAGQHPVRLAQRPCRCRSLPAPTERNRYRRLEQTRVGQRHHVGRVEMATRLTLRPLGTPPAHQLLSHPSRVSLHEHKMNQVGAGRAIPVLLNTDPALGRREPRHPWRTVPPWPSTGAARWRQRDSLPTRRP
jgi:hypothetical protein